VDFGCVWLGPFECSGPGAAAAGEPWCGCSVLSHALGHPVLIWDNAGTDLYSPLSSAHSKGQQKFELLQEAGSGWLSLLPMKFQLRSHSGCHGAGFHPACQQYWWEQSSLLLGKSKLLLINRSYILEMLLWIY